VKIGAAEKAPKEYIKTIADLEHFMNETIAAQKVFTEDGKPKIKMNATNAKGLNAMKQKIKRNNKDYSAQIGEYREDKFGYMMSDEEEEVAPVAKPRSKRDIYVTDVAGEDDQGFSTVGRGGRTLQYTPESIFAHLRSITESRGKKNTDRAEQIRIMERLLAVAVTPYQKIRVLLTVISTRFDLTTGSTATFMSQEQWKLYTYPPSPPTDMMLTVFIGPTRNLEPSLKYWRKTAIWWSLRTPKHGKMMRSHRSPLQGRSSKSLEALCLLSSALTMNLHGHCNISTPIPQNTSNV